VNPRNKQRAIYMSVMIHQQHMGQVDLNTSGTNGRWIRSSGSLGIIRYQKSN